MTRRRRGGLVPAMVVALVSVLAIGAGPTEARATRTMVAVAPVLDWRPCGDSFLAYAGLDCAELAVPLDHAEPTGPTITLALSRRVHTTATARGTIVLNPGGPGGSGTFTPALADYVPGTVADSYDWVGFDPRGVGASRPALRCDQRVNGPDRPSFVPTTSRLQRYWRKHTAAYARSCAGSAAARLLPHLATTDTVGDVESIREALGVEQISWYGFSYGTYLGQVYATAHPGRVDKMILDGVVNPRRVWYQANLDQDVAFDRTMDAFWGYVARHPAAFRLGISATGARSAFRRELSRLKARPVAGGRLGPDELTDAMLDAAYGVEDWPTLAGDFSRLVRTGAGSALYTRYAQENLGDDNAYAVYLGTSCTDGPWFDWARTRADATRLHTRHPFVTWDNTWFNAPCLAWAAPSRTRAYPVRDSADAPSMLLVSETHDGATPFSGALEVRSIFRRSALVEGVGGTTHAGTLSGVACVDGAIATYLHDGTLPRRLSGDRADKRCPRVPVPSVTGSGRVGGTGGLTRIVRERLTAAQRTGR